MCGHCFSVYYFSIRSAIPSNRLPPRLRLFTLLLINSKLKPIEVWGLKANR
jgi:hypothetical protein